MGNGNSLGGHYEDGNSIHNHFERISILVFYEYQELDHGIEVLFTDVETF
jgi:hypothetical protein